MHDKIIQWIYALRAYSVCLKNLESIDHDAKVKHIQTLMDGWSAGTYMVITLLPLLFNGGEVKFGASQYRFVGLRIIDGRLIRFLLVNVPSIVSGYIRSDLGTEKLSKQLKEMSVDDAPLSELFRTALLSDLKSDSFLQYVKSLLKNYRRHNFILEATIFKMRDVFFRYGFTGPEASELKRIIAEADADRRGLEGRIRDRDISAGVQALEKRKSIDRIKQK